MKYLITGGCGFLGSHLAAEVLKRGEELVVFDSLTRLGSRRNLEWLKTKGNITFQHGDIRIQNDVFQIVRQAKPDVVFHLAGQVAMTTSIQNPLADFQTNALGTVHLLEAVREHVPKAAIIYSSTNKVYGDLEDYRYEETDTRYVCKDFPEGFDEKVPLNFQSPYGCSKGSADQYLLDYHRIHGLKTAVFRHSSIFGPNQFATADQGWIGWFVMKAIEAHTSGSSRFDISGTGKQVRDVLFSTDIVDCYFSAAKNIDRISGQAFNIGGGMKNSLSLLELFQILEEELKVKLVYDKLQQRISDQRVFVANTKKATDMFGWSPKVSAREGLKEMIQWSLKNV